MAKHNAALVVHADDLITFRSLKTKEEQSVEDHFELDLRQATRVNETKNATLSKLNKVVQLSGFSDPVYVEAYVHVQQYDILLDGNSNFFFFVPLGGPRCGVLWRTVILSTLPLNHLIFSPTLPLNHLIFSLCNR